MAARSEPECHLHLVPIEPSAGCPYCRRFLAAAPDPDEMSSADRLAELERWLECGPSLPPALLRGRIEALVGRPVMPYELASPEQLWRSARRPRRRAWAERLGS